FDTLVMRPAALRILDRVDVLLVDPAALTGDVLTVTEIRGVTPEQRGRVWAAAESDVDSGLLGAGVHGLTALSPAHRFEAMSGRGSSDVEIVVAASPDPLAEAVIAAARQANLQLLTLDVAELGSLRSAFDDLLTVGGDRDAALRDGVLALQRAGRCVTVLGIDAPQAFAAADLSLAVAGDEKVLVWATDLVVPDLGVAWRVLSAVPGAKTACRRGVELSAGGSFLGGLLMLPGVRGRGIGPVVAAAAAGLVEGHALAVRTLRRPAPTPAPVIAWHALTIEQTVDELRALTAVADRRSQGGPVGRPQSGTGSWVAARQAADEVHQFVAAVRAELNDPLTPVLAIGATASAVLGSPVDAALVGSVLTGNALLSAVQRHRAEHRVRSLLAGQSPAARVTDLDVLADDVPSHIRAAIVHEEAADERAWEFVPARALRPGEVIEVRGGEVVPADARVVAAEGVEVDESSLSGESLPIGKQPQPTPGAGYAERSCMLYEGTALLTGRARAVVVAVGASTAAGRADALAPRRSGHRGLQTQLGHLTSRVLPATLASGGAVTGAGLLRGAGIRQAVASGVSVAVAAVPEGLPLVATLAQQAAARRLAELGVLVRAPRSVEALGRVDVVCFDKTGTLSENRLQVTTVEPQESVDADEVLSTAAVASPRPPPGQPPPHATDAAVLQAAGTPPDRDRELPFRPGRDFAAGLQGCRLAVKGSPETVLAACNTPGDGRARAQLTERMQELASAGLRVIAVAERQLSPQQLTGNADDDSLERFSSDGLTFLGFLGLADTPRAGAAELLSALAEREIGVRLITGDHPLTARAIAMKLGITVPEHGVITSAQWEQMSHRQRAQAVERGVVYARMSPQHKVEIVQELTRAGHVCAMVGDGANDAAAIRTAAVGVGVSSHGSDPARGAADVVLTDGRVGSLLEAIGEGQQLWQQVQSAVTVLLGGNAGEVAFTLIGTALRGQAPLSTRQLLLVNMLTDALPAAALAVSPTRASPAARQRGLDNESLVRMVVFRGATTTLGATGAWITGALTGRPRRASTIGLVALVSTQLGQTLIDSREPLVLLTVGGSLAVLGVLVSTPGVSQLLGCTPLGPMGWAQALVPAAGATAIAAAVPALRRADRLTGSVDHLMRDTGAQQQPVQAPHGGQQGLGDQRDQNLIGQSLADGLHGIQVEDEPSRTR
ncbi:MAG TPA: cation-translocating P-type ATPase, partial [Jatrophihabitans sp.]|nr:cation-translocating P-type ATPase [Jatrophihabitans sp.]